MTATPAESNLWSTVFSRKGFVGLMVVASVALSLASFYTTFQGMTQYMRVPWVTALITFGLQGTMFAMAWIISNMLGTGTRNVVLMLVTFALCAFVSVFFSFASLFGQIFDNDMRDQVNAARLRAVYQETVGGLSRQLASEAETRHRALTNGDAFQRWEDNVNTVVKVANTAPEALRRRALETRRDLELALQNTSARIGEVEAELRLVAPGLSSENEQRTFLSEQIEATRQQIIDLSTQRDQMTGEIARLEQEMELERSGVGSVAGEGPAFRRLRDQRDAVVRDLAGVETRLSSAEARADSLTDQRAEIDASLRGGSSREASLTSELEALRRSERKARDALETAEAGGGWDPERTIQAIAADLQRARRAPDGLAEAVSRVLNACNSLLGELQAQGETGGDEAEILIALGSADCNTSDIQSAVNTIDDLAQRATRFDSDCAAGAPLASSDEGTLFDGAVDKIEQCIALSSQQASEEREALNRLVSTRGPNAHPFVVAQNALIEDKLPLAYMAFLLALIIDCLILLAALLANYVGKSRREKALRALLHWEDDESGQVFVDLPTTHPLYAAMYEEALQMQVLGHARLESARGGMSARLMLNASAVDYIRDELDREAGKTHTHTPRQSQTGDTPPEGVSGRGFP